MTGGSRGSADRSVTRAARARPQMIGIERAAIAAGHRADAFLDAGAGQEMELDVGRLLGAVAPPEGAALDDVGGDRPLAEQRIFEAGDRLPAQLLVAVDAVRAVTARRATSTSMWSCRFWPTPGRSWHDLDALLAEMGGRADAGQHQEFGRADRAGGDDHLALGAQHARRGRSRRSRRRWRGRSPRRSRLTVASVRSVRFLRAKRRLEIADRRAAAPAVAGRGLVEAGAFLLAAVEVGVERKAGLLRRLHEDAGQRMRRAAGDAERPVDAVLRAGQACRCPRSAGSTAARRR